MLVCEECITNERPNGHRFRVRFDVLVVATGCKTDTFGTPGVVEAEGREVHLTPIPSLALALALALALPLPLPLPLPLSRRLPRPRPVHR